MGTERAANRQTLRTRLALRKSLLDLVGERGWEAVRVQDVCARADVSRSSFYVHFADKEDLLLSGFDDLHEALSGARAASTVPFGFAEALVSHAAHNNHLAKAVAGRQSAQQMNWRFRDLVTALVEAELRVLQPQLPSAKIVATFIAGGFAELLSSWLEDPKRGSPLQLASEFRRLAGVVVQASPHLT